MYLPWLKTMPSSLWTLCEGCRRSLRNNSNQFAPAPVPRFNALAHPGQVCRGRTGWAHLDTRTIESAAFFGFRGRNRILALPMVRVSRCARRK
jgi:hypothetical protein